MQLARRPTGNAAVLALVIAGAAAAVGSVPGAFAEPAAAEEDSLVLRGGKEGTVFNDMTIEGEDRIRIEFDRPDLSLELDPRKAPGLDWENSMAVLDRDAVGPTGPLLARSALERSECLPHPWFMRMTAGPVARFRPQVQGVERWSLVVADSRGNTVASFNGQGAAPREITWDGTTRTGGPALPGLTYSYVFEAYDRAGNKRNFMGDGFEISPYVRRDSKQLLMVFAASEINGEPKDPPPAILLEAAGWLNQSENPSAPIRVEARAQSFERAKALADRATGIIKPRLLGDPARVQALTSVEPDAPAAGAIVITATP